MAPGGPSSATRLTAPSNIATVTVTGGAVIPTTKGMRMTVVADAGAAFLAYRSEGMAFKGMAAGAPITLQDGTAAEGLWDGAETWYRNAAGAAVTEASVVGL